MAEEVLAHFGGAGQTRAPLVVFVKSTGSIGELAMKLNEIYNNQLPADLSIDYATAMGEGMANTIDAGGYPPWQQSRRAAMGGYPTLRSLESYLYDSLKYMWHKYAVFDTTGNKVIRGTSVPYANVQKNGGYIYPLEIHYRYGGRMPYGLAFMGAEGYRIYMPPGKPVYIPARDFTRLSPEDSKRLTDITSKYISDMAVRLGMPQV